MNYSIKWNQEYPNWSTQEMVNHLQTLHDDLIEQVLHHSEFDFPEANEVIARVMTK